MLRKINHIHRVRLKYWCSTHDLLHHSTSQSLHVSGLSGIPDVNKRSNRSQHQVLPELIKLNQLGWSVDGPWDCLPLARCGCIKFSIWWSRARGSYRDACSDHNSGKRAVQSQPAASIRRFCDSCQAGSKFQMISELLVRKCHLINIWSSLTDERGILLS